MKIIEKLLTHATIILSIMFIVFFCIDRVNEKMAFINNEISKILLAVLAVLSILTSIALIRRQRKATNKTDDE